MLKIIKINAPTFYPNHKMTTTLKKPTIEDLKKAITDRRLTYLENIVENNPSLLNQNFADEEGLISLATKTYLSSTQRDDKNKSFQILRKIFLYKKIFFFYQTIF